MYDLRNIRGVIGDSAFFSMLESDVISDLKEIPGFGIESIHRIDKDVPKKSPLGPPILPMSTRLVIMRSPSSETIKKAVSACERYSDLHVIMEWEDDTYDKRSKMIKDLVEDRRVIKMIGYIHGHERQRFIKAASMLCKEEGLTLSDEAIMELFRSVPRIKRMTTSERDGKKQRRERLVINLQRVKSEAIRAQCYAGIGNIVGPDHVRDVVPVSRECDAWALIDSICAGDSEMSIVSLDGCVSDIGSANEVLGLIRSQLLMISRVRGIVESMSDPNVEIGDLMGRLVSSKTKYDAWEGGEPSPTSIPGSYRIQKVLDLRGSHIWEHCDKALESCSEAYCDMHGWLSMDWKMVMTRLCLTLCSENCEEISLPDANPM